MNKKCNKTAFISDYIEGNLPEKKKTEFEAHLNACPLCADALKETKEALKAVRSLKEADLPVNFYAKLNMKLDELEEREYKRGGLGVEKMMLKEESNLCCENREPEPHKKFDIRKFFGRGALVFASVFTVLIAYNVINEEQKEKAVVIEKESTAAETTKSKETAETETKQKQAVKSENSMDGGALQVPAKPVLKTAQEEKPRSFLLDIKEEAAPAPAAESASADRAVLDLSAGQTAAKSAAPALSRSEVPGRKKLAAVSDMTEFYGMTGGARFPFASEVNSREEWDKLPQAPVLENINPDFSKYTALVVFAGEKNTAGYSVKFVSIKEEAGSIAVEYTISAPEKDAMTAQVITNPYAVRLIPKTGKQVIFNKSGN